MNSTLERLWIGLGLRESASNLLIQADSARDRRAWARAAELYAVYLKRVPQRADVWVQLGHSQRELNNLAAARISYERARSLSPRSVDPHLQLGHLLIRLADAQNAADSYQSAVGLWPEDADATLLLQLADLARGLGEWPSAADLYTKVLRSWPDRHDIWTQLGHAERERDDLSAATRAYQRAIDLRSDDIETHLQLATLLASQGKRDAAVRLYGRVLDLDPSSDHAMRARRELLDQQPQEPVTPPDRAVEEPAEVPAPLAVRPVRKAVEPANQPGALAFCTVATNHDVERVAALFTDARLFYPEARCVVCVDHSEPDPAFFHLDRCDLLIGSDLLDPKSDGSQYVEKRVARPRLKPALLRKVLADLRYSSAIVVDPSATVTARSDDLLMLLWRRADIVVTRFDASTAEVIGVAARPGAYSKLDRWIADPQQGCSPGAGGEISDVTASEPDLVKGVEACSTPGLINTDRKG